MTFTSNYTRLDFNVTAVNQIGPEGYGPAYLVNGLTNPTTDPGIQHYWYQVGLSYRWPLQNGVAAPGFNMSFEVFNEYVDRFGQEQIQSIFPAVGGGGVDTLLVNNHDLVQLSLYFANGNVTMRAIDWNTTSTAKETYFAYGASSFIGLPTHVANPYFFTGLMTEEYHDTPYYGAGIPTLYSTTTPIDSPVWLWVNELNLNSPNPVFNDNSTTPVQLRDSTAAYFTSNGTAEVANRHGLVTGLTPLVFPSATSGAATGYSNHQADVKILIQDPTGATLRFTNITLTTSFSHYNIASNTSFTLQGSNGTYDISIAIPVSVSAGNYTLVVDVLSWQYLETQANVWIQLPSTIFNETLRVTNAPPSKPPPTSPNTPGPGIPGPSTGVQAAPGLLSQLWTARTLLVPSMVGYVTLVSAIVFMAVRRDSFRRFGAPVYGSTSCPRCGQHVPIWSSACPTCAENLVVLGR